jgi:hypothetical protein
MGWDVLGYGLGICFLGAGVDTHIVFTSKTVAEWHVCLPDGSL